MESREVDPWARHQCCQDAFPVALQSNFDSVDPFSGDEDERVQAARRTETLQWAIGSDLELIQERIEQEEYGQAIQILKVVNNNIDTALLTLRRLSQFWANDDQKNKSNGQWKRFADAANKNAKNYAAAADTAWQQIKTIEDNRRKKAFRVLAAQMLRIAGELNENAGYGYGEAGSHKRAAQSWLLSSQHAQLLLERETVTTKMHHA